MEFVTIGVFGSSEEEFFGKLTANGVDTFCDIRQRRGVRGTQYAFVNSQRLQAKLQSLGIKYEYVKSLAPTTEIRQLQKDEDERKGELKTQRRNLGSIFVKAYNERILGRFPLEDLMSHLQTLGAQKVALFCVEEVAAACHRSLVGARIVESIGCKVSNL